MTGTQTAPRLAGNSNIANHLLNPLLHAALFGLLCALAGNFAGAAGFEFTKITAAICGVVKTLSAPALLGAAGFAVIIVFGWNKFIGDSSAFQGIKNAIVGAVVILGAGTFATAIFGGTCA